MGLDGEGRQGAWPLNVVNTDNRIVANAIRYKVEAPLAKGIAQHQRGFLPGRSILEDILDIEEELLIGSLKDDPITAWFFDFKAAFPSISHDYLHATMEHLGLPGWLCRGPLDVDVSTTELVVKSPSVGAGTPASHRRRESGKAAPCAHCCSSRSLSKFLRRPQKLSRRLASGLTRTTWPSSPISALPRTELSPRSTRLSGKFRGLP
jgi:hypothetical protein